METSPSGSDATQCGVPSNTVSSHFSPSTTAAVDATHQAIARAARASVTSQRGDRGVALRRLSVKFPDLLLKVTDSGSTHAFHRAMQSALTTLEAEFDEAVCTKQGLERARERLCLRLDSATKLRDSLGDDIARWNAQLTFEGSSASGNAALLFNVLAAAAYLTYVLHRPTARCCATCCF